MSYFTRPDMPAGSAKSGDDRTDDSSAAEDSSRYAVPGAPESGGFVTSLAGLVLAAGFPDLDLASWPLIAAGFLLSALGLVRSDTRARLLAAAGLVLALTAAPIDATTSGEGLGPAEPPAITQVDPAPSLDDPADSYGNVSLTKSDYAYLQTLADHNVGVSSTATAISLGHTVCGFVARGHSPSEAEDILIDNGFSASDAAVVVGAAIGAYCYYTSS